MQCYTTVTGFEKVIDNLAPFQKKSLLRLYKQLELTISTKKTKTEPGQFNGFLNKIQINFI